jgi:hypothetical protein
MTSINVAEGLRRLDEIAQAEYGTTFAEAVSTPDDKLTIRRIARLTGIELKRPFSKSQPLHGPSETGAKQQWMFQADLLGPAGFKATKIDSLKGDPSYELELRIYAELEHQGFLRRDVNPFGMFLQNNHSESNWFLMLLRAAQPYLCDGAKGKPSTPPDSAMRKKFWELARVARDGVVDAGLTKSLESAGVTLTSLVPFMAGAPVAVTTGLSWFLIHYAKKGYCNANIETEIIQTLGLIRYENR